MNVDVLKSFKQLKFWTSLLQLFVDNKALILRRFQFTYDLFFAMSVQSKEQDMQTRLLRSFFIQKILIIAAT